jgi:hypothetical protein
LHYFLSVEEADDAAGVDEVEDEELLSLFVSDLLSDLPSEPLAGLAEEEPPPFA